MKIKVYVIDVPIPPWFSKIALPLITVASVLVVKQMVSAAPTPAPTLATFENGQTLSAETLNSNFTELKNAIEATNTALQATNESLGLKVATAIISQPGTGNANDCEVQSQSSPAWLSTDTIETIAGECTVTFYLDTFSGVPICVYQDATGHNVPFSVQGADATHVTLVNNNGNYGPGNLICVGARPQ